MISDVNVLRICPGYLLEEMGYNHFITQFCWRTVSNLIKFITTNPEDLVDWLFFTWIYPHLITFFLIKWLHETQLYSHLAFVSFAVFFDKSKRISLIKAIWNQCFNSGSCAKIQINKGSHALHSNCRGSYKQW